VTNLDNQLTLTGDAEATKHLEQAINSGRHWYIALLEAIGLWTTVEETLDGRLYRYLIDAEAFDWLLLAERLCETANGLLPYDEQTCFLFHGKPPLNLTTNKFKQLIGSTKYHQCLNYYYGITVEEALILAVRYEVRKERRTLGFNSEPDHDDEVHRRIYGSNKAVLLKHFRQEKGYRQLKSISLTELKEFTYWLFKYRLKHCDKARVASDTKKALQRLNSQRFPMRPFYMPGSHR
jgi:hypothetical protein